jgi:hypothetical protein
MKVREKADGQKDRKDRQNDSERERHMDRQTQRQTNRKSTGDKKITQLRPQNHAYETSNQTSSIRKSGFTNSNNYKKVQFDIIP